MLGYAILHWQMLWFNLFMWFFVYSELYSSLVTTLTLVVHLLSPFHDIWPPQIHFLFLPAIIISFTFAHSLIHDAHLMSVHVIPSMFLFILCCTLVRPFSRCIVRSQLWELNVKTGSVLNVQLSLDSSLRLFDCYSWWYYIYLITCFFTIYERHS